MNAFRTELRRAVNQRFKRIDLDRFKAELKEHVTHFLFEQTQRSPIVIPVVNVIGAKGVEKPTNGDMTPEKQPQEQAEELQKRYQQMRAKLLKLSQIGFNSLNINRIYPANIRLQRKFQCIINIHVIF